MVNTADCGSVTRGFESHHSPHFFLHEIRYYRTSWGHRQAVRQRTLTPSPRGFESRQPSQKKGLCVLQSPFFNKINPLGICETALYAVKCLRMFIKRKTADLRNHLAQQLRVFQHGARAQVVLVERLAIVVRHEERRLQDFEQCFFADVGIGIVDEHARAASPPV